MSFWDDFDTFEDSRIDRKKLYSISEILLATLCAITSGAEGWQDVENFAKSKINFLKKYLPFNNGIPSNDTFHGFFRAIDPKKFSRKFFKLG